MEKKAVGKGMKSQKQAYLFLAPSLIILTIFVFVPLVGAIAISIMNINIYMNDISFAGLKNYLRMFSDVRVGNATLNTFYFALLEVPLQILLALLLVMFMTKNTRWHKLMRTTFYLPYVCSMTAVSIMWSMLLNKNYGMLPYLLGRIGIQMPGLLTSTTWAMPTVIFVTVWKGFGYTLTVLSAAALGVSNSLYEAAELDGAGGLQKFRYVTIPGIRDTIGFCAVTTLITALQVFDQIYVMTEGGPQYKTETLVGYIYNKGFQTAPFDLFEWVGDVILLLIMLIVILPLLWLFVSSFKSDADVIKWPPHFFPADWVADQYRYVVKAIPVLRMLRNTVIFAGSVTVISLFFDSMAAYAFSRMHFRGKKVIFNVILLTMMVPFQVIMIPLYLEEFNLGILNTYAGLILPRAASAYGIYMLTSFFGNIPKSLDEAARIDGMKEFQIYSRIIAPLAKPAFVTLGIFHFMNNWNDLLYPMMLTSSVEMRTLSAGLAVLVGSNSIKFGPTLAATVISIAPLLILFLFGQRFFMEGIATSGMKE